MAVFFFLLGVAIVVVFVVWGYKAAQKAAGDNTPRNHKPDDSSK